MKNFFVCGEVNRVDVIPEIIRKLQVFLGWFRTQTSLRLFATSLLIVYEGTPAHQGEPTMPVDIRLVDFAHTYGAAVLGEGATDDNTLYGLENFAQCLSLIRNQIWVVHIFLSPTFTGLYNTLTPSLTHSHTHTLSHMHTLEKYSSVGVL